ncbi:MAG: DUF4367 domain-containing protein [Clostridiales bacterium]|jgi:hypothetical protein|nr:DUF4367 domain-containing protein [Clostridiales bacterium]
MSSLLTQRHKANEKIIETMLEYGAACHVENIANEINEYNMDNVYYPTELDEKMKKLISSYKKRNKRKEMWKTGRKIFTKVAVFLFITILGMSILAVSVEAFRMKIFNFVVEVQDKLTSVGLEENDEVTDDSSHIYMPSYIPEGYKIMDVQSFKYITAIQYVNDTGDTIFFEQCKEGQSILRIDTENAESNRVIINGIEAFIINKNQMTGLVWHESEMTFTLMGTLNENELIKMAESIKK